MGGQQVHIRGGPRQPVVEGRIVGGHGSRQPPGIAETLDRGRERRIERQLGGTVEATIPRVEIEHQAETSRAARLQLQRQAQMGFPQLGHLGAETERRAAILPIEAVIDPLQPIPGEAGGGAAPARAP